MTNSGENGGAGDYIAIKALESGVTVTGVTRGAENRFLHTEKLEEGEVWIAQFTEHISAMKIRGHAKVLTAYGEIESGKQEKSEKAQRYTKGWTESNAT